MARLPRLTVAGYPHHVVQRGNNRQHIFVDAADYQRYLELLAEHAEREKVAIHAYVLMPNHVHLLATPQSATGLPRLMQALGQRYVQYFNHRHRRSGTLWEGRYKSTLIESDRYLLACMVYLDLNPVRAGMVSKAVDYLWSSHAHYSGARPIRWICPHELYWSLGNTPFAREAAYGDLVAQGLAPSTQKAMTDAVIKGWAMGSAEFAASVHKRTGRRATPKKAGRPPGKAKKL